MPQLPFVTLDVFTKTRFEGNPLAVVQIPANQNVSTPQLQAIAREFNLSETLFIHEKQTAADGVPEWRVRIFVTTAEIPFAGHPTIGAACYAITALAENNESRGRLVCNAGPIEFDYDHKDGIAKAAIPHNFHLHVQYPMDIGEAYKFHPALKQASKAPKSIDVVSPVDGMNFVCTELPDLETLGVVDLSGPYPRAQLDDGWDAGLFGAFLYVVTDQSDSGIVKVRTRMIQQALEDPATGSASCGLAALLAMRLKIGRTTRFEFTQAVEMGRRSDIGVVLMLNEGMDAVEKIELSGSAVKIMEGILTYD